MAKNRGIYRNKSQTLYRYLPQNWVSYKDKNDDRLGDFSYTMKVVNWNTKPIQHIYTAKVKQEIIRMIKLFGSKGGDITSFNLNDIDSLKLLQAAENEGIPDILGEINPLLFYCGKCGSTKQITRPTINFNHLRCESCKTKMKQLQMLYSCECGFADGVSLPYTKKNNDLKYKPGNSVSNNKDTFTFFYFENSAKKTVEMFRNCPTCNERLYPKNAVDRINFRAHSLKSVNLIDANEGKLFERELDAKKVIVCRWLELIGENQYKSIISNQENFFNNSNVIDEEFENQVDQFMKIIGGNVSRDIVREGMLKQRKQGAGVDVTLSDILELLSSNVPDLDDTRISQYASILSEYMTILNPRKRITLSDAIVKAIQVENIESEDNVFMLNKKLGISDVQLSYEIELLFSTYGFTRRHINPISAKNRLKLNSFLGQGGKSNVYNMVLDTEGILIQFDKKRIIDWLVVNKIVSEHLRPIETEMKLKAWFLENVNLALISNFSSIGSGTSMADIEVTKYVYGLLHSISHVLIKSAGVLSGLDKDSLSELIFPNVPAIFIYSNSSQGIALGALAGMFEQNYYGFLKRAYEEGENCIFDPICSERDGAACSSCMFLSEISCINFNNDLSRDFLYGNEIIKGFWK
jgi:hypothetical protein